MAHPSEELLRQGFEAFSQGDVAAFAALLADDIVFHFPGRGPLAGDHRGKDQVLATVAKQSELTGGTFRVELHDILANDEHAVALNVARAERGGRSWEDNAVLVFHIRDGKISEFWLHPGDQYAGDEFFLS
jgi:ketosteroid isomerase-like protein